MADHQLYCFTQSGNSYKVALMLDLIGASWEPVFVDFFQWRDAIERLPRADQ
jgi:glutathione S-transferase